MGRRWSQRHRLDFSRVFTGLSFQTSRVTANGGLSGDRISTQRAGHHERRIARELVALKGDLGALVLGVLIATLSESKRTGVAYRRVFGHTVHPVEGLSDRQAIQNVL